MPAPPPRPRRAARRARSTRNAAPVTPLNRGGYGGAAAGRPKPGAFSAARVFSEELSRHNGRAVASPTVVVPDASAAAVEARRQRALLRLIDPLLDADGGGGGGDPMGVMAMETAAFDGLPAGQQLPPHPDLTMLLRGEDPAGAQAKLPRFGGASGAFRACPLWHAIAKEKLRPSSYAQQREHGAKRLHVMLRCFASALNAMLFSAYSAGVATEDDLVANEPLRLYALLINLFSLKAVRHHCRVIDEAAAQRGIKASTLHVHYAHCHMLSSLADAASPTLAGADAKAASGVGVHALLSAKSKLCRSQAQRVARSSNTFDAAVSACGAVPSGAALSALRAHAELVLVQFGHRIHNLPAPFGVSEADALQAVLAAALVLGLRRGVRLGDLQQLTYASLWPPPTARGAAAAPPAAGSHAIVAAPCVDLAHFADGKVAHGVKSGFEEGATIPLSAAAHAALVSIYGWFSPVGSAALAPAAVPLLPDVVLLYHDRAAAPPALAAALAAPLATHAALLRASDAVAGAAEEWLGARHAQEPPRAVPDATARCALQVALCSAARLWRVVPLPLLHHCTWRWVRRWVLTAQAAAWAARERYCQQEVAPGCTTTDAAAGTIAARAGTSRAELVNRYTIGPWPVRARAAECDDGGADLVECDDGGGAGASGRCASQWCGTRMAFDERLGRFPTKFR